MSQQPVHVRRPWAIAVLTIVTVGIYWPIWYFKVNRELRDVGRLRGDESLGSSRPWRSVAAVTLGGLVFIPAVVSYVRFARRLRDGERAAGAEPRGAGLIAALLVAAQILFNQPFGTTGSTLLVVAAMMFAASVAATVLVQLRMNAVARTLAGSPTTAPPLVDAVLLAA